MRKKQFVYRVENDKGEGPYEIGTSECKYNIPDVYYEFRPLPEDDFYPDDFRKIMDEGLFFGFLTAHDAERWFTREGLRILSENGYYLRRVPVSKIIKSASGYQVAFDTHPSYKLPSKIAFGYEFKE